MTQMKHSSTPWWMTDTYDVETPIPDAISKLKITGPKGVALVKAWPDGTTQKGWGLNPPPGEADGFMPRYLKDSFNPRRALYGYNKGQWNFAFIMRSLQLVCIDIDGKNGGFEGAKKLGMLPRSLAEVSKSGDGYHLFYLTDEKWDDELGFGKLGDRIGIEQGVDIRWTGCVYHHPQQRWNRRELVDLPLHLEELLIRREQKAAASNARILSVLAGEDETEILMVQAELLAELGKDIPDGKRNQTLFAIGSQMLQAGIEGWEEKIRAKALDVDLDGMEADKIVANIERYATATP